MLEERATQLASLGQTEASTDYWNRVTRAEAQLLAGRIGAAHRTYHAAFSASVHATPGVPIG